MLPEKPNSLKKSLHFFASRPKNLPLKAGDYLPQPLRRPVEHLPPADLRHRHRAHVVARQFQRTRAPDTLLCVWREGREAVAPREHRQVGLRCLATVEAAEVLVLLRETPDH